MIPARVFLTMSRARDTYSAVKLLWKSAVALEKAMATHSSTLAWKIPWMKEPVRLQSMGSRKVGHN